MGRIYERDSSSLDSTSVLIFEKGSGTSWTTYKISFADLKDQVASSENLAYNSTTHKLTFTKSNGNTVEVDLSSLVNEVIDVKIDGTSILNELGVANITTMVGTDGTNPGTKGLVPAPSAADIDKFLGADGTWKTPQDTTYDPATTSANGLMSSTDKAKLDNIEANANNYTLPKAAAGTLGGIKVGNNLSIDNNGVLSSFVSSTDITPAVNAWLSANVDPATGYVLDASCTSSQAAAPANKVGELKSALTDNKNEYLATVEPSTENIVAYTDFTTASSDTTYSADVSSITVTVSAVGQYRYVATADTFIQNNCKIGHRYRLGGKAVTVSGTSKISIAIRGTKTSATNRTLAKVDLNTGGEWYVDFVADAYMKDVALFVTLDNLSRPVVTFSNLYLKELESPALIPNSALYLEQGTFNANGVRVSSTTKCRTATPVKFNGKVSFKVNEGYFLLMYYASDYSTSALVVTDRASVNFNDDVVDFKISKIDETQTITADEANANFAFYYDDLYVDRYDGTPFQFRIASYNVGHFSKGTSSDPAGTQEDIQPWHDAINEIDADFLAIEENDPYFDASHLMSTYDTIYNIYKYYKTGAKSGYACNGLLSRYNFVSARKIDYVDRTQNTYFLDCTFTVKGRIIHICVTHLDWYDITQRQTQINQVITYCQNFKYVIIIGDFNPSGRVNGEFPEGIPVMNWEEDYKIFKDAGYLAANTGYFGVLNTLPNEIFPVNPCDNIFVKGSTASIDHVKVYEQNVSDHYPIVADVTLY